jgi:hypothetical protein
MSNLIARQWTGYERNHRSRINLLLHIVSVPPFLVGNVALVLAFVRWSLLEVLAAMATMLISFAMQAYGHTREAVPPEPFASPTDAVGRIFCEQWITFPRFVFSGSWFRALRETTE